MVGAPNRGPGDEYSSSNLRKHTSRNPVQRWLIDRFHRTAAGLVAQTDPLSILDSGCGEGFAVRAIMKRPLRTVVGLDASIGALGMAKRLNAESQFVAGSVLHLPFPDRAFDIVLCLEVLEHLDDPRRALVELCRVSRQWLLLSVPNEPFFRGANFLRGKNVRAWGNDPGHVNHWSAAAFQRFVGSECSIRACRTTFPWTVVLAVVRRSSPC
jgi:SAM-dependent methyltransferase